MTWTARQLVGLGVGALACVAVGAALRAGEAQSAQSTQSARSTQGSPTAPQRPPEQLEVPPPPFTEGIFPCSSCHASLKVNRTKRELTEMHTDIELKHGFAQVWCLDCHNADNRDVLHLASGELVPFDESYRLCGQCHGEKYRDWRAGVHGRRTGYWNGHKLYLLCVNCHNPHQPRFKPLVPKPAPVPPSRPRK
jgi:hypothetical protein